MQIQTGGQVVFQEGGGRGDGNTGGTFEYPIECQADYRGRGQIAKIYLMLIT